MFDDPLVLALGAVFLATMAIVWLNPTRRLRFSLQRLIKRLPSNWYDTAGETITPLADWYIELPGWKQKLVIGLLRELIDESKDDDLSVRAAFFAGYMQIESLAASVATLFVGTPYGRLREAQILRSALCQMGAKADAIDPQLVHRSAVSARPGFTFESDPRIQAREALVACVLSRHEDAELILPLLSSPVREVRDLAIHWFDRLVEQRVQTQKYCPAAIKQTVMRAASWLYEHNWDEEFLGRLQRVQGLPESAPGRPAIEQGNGAPNDPRTGCATSG